MLDSMEHAYSMHQHTRSLSYSHALRACHPAKARALTDEALASTIMPVPSDASAFTSLTASPMEAQDLEELPIELKTPLPPSTGDSDEEVDHEAKLRTRGLDSTSASANTEVSQPEDTEPISEAPLAHTMDRSPPAEAHTPSPIPLEELAHLVELERCQRSRAVAIETDIDRLSLSCGLDRRLISTLSIAYGNLIDQYKTDDQAGFGGLYEACEQLKASCDTAGATTYHAGPSPENDAVLPKDLDRRSSIHLLPPNDQDLIVAFLTRIRTEPDFLSDRISSLTPTELTALTSSYHPAGIDFSVLPNHSHGKTQYYSTDSQMMKLSRRMDNVHHFHNRDPLFTLLYGVFDSFSRPGSSEHFRRTDVWSTTCARIFTEGFTGAKPGGDELAIATLDSFANFQDWGMKPAIETYLMKILVEGSFLLDPDRQTMNSSDPMEIHKAKAAIAEADFLDKALTELVGLLATESRNQAVPETALNFVHAVLRKIEDRKLRLRAKHFIVCRWYFATFVSSIVVYPEVRGLMMAQHISSAAREMILQKLVVHMQHRAFDVILESNSGTPVTPEVRDGIMAIFQWFEPSLDDPRPPLRTPDRDENAPIRFLMLSPLDIVGLIQTLYPDRPLLPGTNDPQENDVAPPSTAGSSTLNASTNDSGSACASSSAPSTSGTSVTSRTVVSEHVTEDAQVGKQYMYDITKVDHGDGPLKSKDFAKRELPLLMKSTCRRLATLLGSSNTSDSDFSQTAWAFIYYSGDGATLTLLSPTKMGKNKDLKTSHPIGDLEVLKRGIVKLLGQAVGSEFPELVTPIRAEYNPASNQPDPLFDLMKASVDNAWSSLDFGSADLWWQTLGIYRNCISSMGSQMTYPSLLRDIADGLQRKIESATRAGKAGELRLRSLESMRKRQIYVLAKMEGQRKALRVKMWYSSDVMHSATYEEASHITRALRAMASSKRAKQPASMASWARQRLRGSGAFARPEAQTLEAISAPRDYGGQSKLADDQVELTSRWLTRRSIENFCKGEERIHRFCFEIQKSINKIAGPNPVKNPVLWSSNLFRREKASFDTHRLVSSAHTSPLMGFRPSSTSYEHGRLHLGVLDPPDPHVNIFGTPKAKPTSNNSGGFWNTDQHSPASIGLGTLPLLPPTPTSPTRSWSSKTFTSTSPSSETIPFLSYPSPGERTLQANNEADFSPSKMAFTEDIKMSLRSLLISDLGYLLWRQGTETDVWVNACIANENDPGVMEKTLDSRLTTEVAEQDKPEAVYRQDEPSDETPSVILNNKKVESSLPIPYGDESKPFPFSEAYALLLRKMSLSPDPRAKLNLLHELEGLILRSLQRSSTLYDAAIPAPPFYQNPSQGDLSFRAKSVPRTKATSLEEVIANCTERRAATLRSKDRHSGFTQSNSKSTSTATHVPGTDDIVKAFLSIFRDQNLRPLTLFRDLQYIAAFIPPETLDQTVQGKAFWDAGLAALALKEDLCESLINRANQITAYHISPSKSTKPLSETALANTTLRDAANIWLITAKEGSPAAARELGLFYLTHPELLPRVTIAFSKAKDVYKSVMSIDARIGDKEKGALDRSTFAVVFHWMEIAANGGDKDAKDFLNGIGELSGGRR